MPDRTGAKHFGPIGFGGPTTPDYWTQANQQSPGHRSERELEQAEQPSGEG